MTKLIEFFRSKSSFMSGVGGLFVVFYLGSYFYQMIQINFFFSKSKISPEIFERVVTDANQHLIDIVMIIVLFFFKGNSLDNNNNKTQ